MKYSVIKEFDYKKEGVLRFALCYPNTSYVGYSYLGFHVVHNLINESRYAVSHHCFSLPDFPDRTPTYNIPMDEYHFIGFSVPYEMDFLNIVKHLEKINIPKFSNKRNKTDSIIFAGGPAITINPLPLIPFVDLFFIGEGEESLPLFIDTVYNTIQTHGYDRYKILNAVKDIQGIYVPLFHGKDFFSKRTVIKNLDAIKSINKIRIKKTVFPYMYYFEIQRGCPFQCKFCASRVISHPFRFRSVDNIKSVLSDIEDGSDLGLIGTAILSHPDIYEILDYFKDRKFKVHFSSLRSDLIKKEFLPYLKYNNVKTLTIAPEVATDKMKKEINKFVDMEKVISMLSEFYEYGIREIKMYFLYGLPNEDDNDIEEMVYLVNKVKEKFNGMISVSINPVIPKKNTEYENYLPNIEEVKYKYKHLKKLFKGIGVKTSIQSVSMLNKQIEISLGDENTLL